MKVGGHNVNNLRYGGGNVLIAHYKEDSQQLSEEESRKKGLKLNSKSR